MMRCSSVISFVFDSGYRLEPNSFGVHPIQRLDRLRMGQIFEVWQFDIKLV